MGTVVLIGTVAIIVAIVGCFFIWRLDASRAEEVEHITPPPVRDPVRDVPRVVGSHEPKHLQQ